MTCHSAHSTLAYILIHTEARTHIRTQKHRPWLSQRSAAAIAVAAAVVADGRKGETQWPDDVIQRTGERCGLKMA